MKFIYFFLSFILVAFGQPAWIKLLGFFCSFLGFCLFFRCLFFVNKKFWLSFFWFLAVSAVHLSWMTSTKYVGPWMFLVYFLILIFLSLEFAILSLMVFKVKLNILNIFFISAVWTIFEWSRLFIFSGFSWNPIGLFLANNHYSMQLASFFGIYGLSFWVMMTNLFTYRALFLKKNYAISIFCIIFPIFFGLINQHFQEKKNVNKISAILIQPALSPSEKEPFFEKDKFIYPLQQWERIFFSLKDKIDKKVDFIVLPEVAVAFGSFRCFYDYEDFLKVFTKVFGKKFLLKDLSLKEPFAKKFEKNKKVSWKVSNAFFAKAISDFFETDLVIGLENRENGKNFTSSFYFSYKDQKFYKYDKEILVPLVEYFPFEWVRNIAKKYDIYEVFEKGNSEFIFGKAYPFSMSICYEETYGNLMRKRRKKGAEFFINITNDAWFPRSKLSFQHFEHGRIRSVENGIPILRACNTGISAAVDCFGRVIKIFKKKGFLIENSFGSLYVTVPLKNYFTLYSFWGDNFIIIFSFLCIFFYFLKKMVRIFF